MSPASTAARPACAVSEVEDDTVRRAAARMTTRVRSTPEISPTSGMSSSARTPTRKHSADRTTQAKLVKPSTRSPGLNVNPSPKARWRA